MKTPLECTNYFIGEQPWKTAGEDTQYIIENDNGKVFVAFCGSNSKIDWLNNFRFWKVPYKNMEIKFRVHSGFLKAWQACRDIVMQEIMDCNPTEIQITGHSYGGAIATLCMEDCWYRFINEREKNNQPSLRGKIKCYTFGAPRILGLWNYKKVVERWEGTTLFNNSSDIVPTLPPFIMFYKHVTEQTHIGKLRHWWGFFNVAYHMCDRNEGYRNSLLGIYGQEKKDYGY